MKCDLGIKETEVVRLYLFSAVIETATSQEGVFEEWAKLEHGYRVSMDQAKGWVGQELAASLPDPLFSALDKLGLWGWIAEELLSRIPEPEPEPTADHNAVRDEDEARYDAMVLAGLAGLGRVE